MAQPPGRSTRSSSREARRASFTCSRTWLQMTASNAPSRSGRRSTSTCTIASGESRSPLTYSRFPAHASGAAGRARAPGRVGRGARERGRCARPDRARSDGDVPASCIAGSARWVYAPASGEERAEAAATARTLDAITSVEQRPQPPRQRLQRRRVELALVRHRTAPGRAGEISSRSARSDRRVSGSHQSTSPAWATATRPEPSITYV